MEIPSSNSIGVYMRNTRIDRKKCSGQSISHHVMWTYIAGKSSIETPSVGPESYKSAKRHQTRCLCMKSGLRRRRLGTGRNNPVSIDCKLEG